MTPRTSLACLLFAACSGPPILVPPSEPASGECEVLDPPQLGALRPGPVAGPLKLGQILDLRGAPTDVQWRALPNSSDAELVRIAGDGEEDTKVRVRAMAGIAVRHPDGGDGPMRAALADAKADAALRRGAARALADAYLAAGFEALKAALADEDALLREAVVKALAPNAKDLEVRTALEALLATERHPLVREALDAALKEKDAK